ncbi:unnamed protein product [Ilex paraguariensis]|uniref:Uncharacterized protein n=1 Tax=Ilex paraguariensis TaxID=185542 RepID=A0ABC8S6U7_9AQUA
MSVVSNFTACQGGQLSVALADNGLRRGSASSINQMAKFSRPFVNEKFQVSRLAVTHLRRVFQGRSIQMTVVDERLAHGKVMVKPSEILAYDLVQGALVRWSYIMDKSVPDPPTAVLLHGILGSRKNWGRCLLYTFVLFSKIYLKMIESFIFSCCNYKLRLYDMIVYDALIVCMSSLLRATSHKKDYTISIED